MKNYRKHIDDFFREKLGNYTETPPPEVWEDLEVRLDGLVHQPGYTRLFKHFVIVSLIAVLGISIARRIQGNNIALSPEITTQNTSTPKSTTNLTANPPKPGENSGILASATVPQTPGNKVIAGNTSNQSEVAKAGNSLGQNGNTIQNFPKKSNHSHKLNANRISNNNSQRQLAYQSKALGNLPLSNTNQAGRTGNSTNTQNTLSGSVSQSTNQGGPHIGLNNEETVNQFNSGKNQSDPVVNTPKSSTKDSTINSQNKTSKADEKQKVDAIRGYSRFEAGVKAGVERGFSNNGVTKGVFSPYLQYNLSSKFAIMTQPAVKYASFDYGKVGTSQSYYKENADSTTSQYLPTQQIHYVEGGSTDTFYVNHYTYKQSHDSVVKSYTYKGAYTEFEIPLLGKFKLTKQFSIYGGLNIVYSKIPGITENTYTKQGIVRSANVTDTSMQPGISLPVNSIITYTGSSIATYKGPVYSAPQSGNLLFGYMIGFSYQYSHRWMFDALIQQEPMSPATHEGYFITNPLSQACFRLSLGYKLTK